MSKKVILNGIEVLTLEDDISARSFFDFTEEVIGLLETDLDASDANFTLSIRTEFFMDQPPKHSIYVNGLNISKTKAKLVRILQRAAGILRGCAIGTARINLMIIDR